MASAKKWRTRSPIFLRSEESTNTVEQRVSRASSNARAQTLDAVRTTGVYLAPRMPKSTSSTELSAAGTAPAGLEGPLGAIRQHRRRLMPARHHKRSDGRRRRGAADAARQFPTRGGGAIVQWVQPKRGGRTW